MKPSFLQMDFDARRLLCNLLRVAPGALIAVARIRLRDEASQLSAGCSREFVDDDEITFAEATSGSDDFEACGMRDDFTLRGMQLREGSEDDFGLRVYDLLGSNSSCAWRR